jgi:hypothetical protein
MKWYNMYLKNSKVWPGQTSQKGRMPILSKRVHPIALAAIIRRCNEGNGFAMVGSFYSFIERYIRMTMQEYNVIDYRTAQIRFSMRAIQRLFRDMCDGVIRQGDQQDLARFRRNIDLTGHITSAATMHAAMADEHGSLDGVYAVKRALIFKVLDFQQNRIALFRSVVVFLAR